MTLGHRTIARSDFVLSLAVVVIVAAVAVAAVSARNLSLDDRARAIEAQLRCPTCQGLSIADSPATSATQMRALVRQQLASGASDDEVRGFFVARYGRWILLDPPIAGPDLLLWFAPAVIIALGAGLVVRRARARGAGGATVRSWHSPPPGRPSRPITVLVGGAMVLALAVPIAAAVGPRLAGREVSGPAAPGAAPSIADLEAFVRAEPRNVEALVALGNALHTANRVSEAADRYRAALELDPANVDALLGVGTILLGADRPDAAAPVFDRILTGAPDQPDALLYRAVARLRLDGGVSARVRSDLARFLDVAGLSDGRREMARGLLAGDTPPPSAPPSGPTSAPVPTSAPPSAPVTPDASGSASP